MKRIIYILLFLSFAFSVNAEEVRVWYMPDGIIRHTVCPEGVDRAKCIADALKANPELKNVEYDDIDRAKMPKEDRKAWKGGKGKSLTIDSAKLAEIKKVEKDEKTIQLEMKKILRQQAIENLKASGEIE